MEDTCEQKCSRISVQYRYNLLIHKVRKKKAGFSNSKVICNARIQYNSQLIYIQIADMAVVTKLTV